jgi:hypothetical protein
MSATENAQIEALKREYEQNRARVWADERIRPEHKQAEVNRLWREFDAEREALRQEYAWGRSGVDPAADGPRKIFALRPRRRLWK